MELKAESSRDLKTNVTYIRICRLIYHLYDDDDDDVDDDLRLARAQLLIKSMPYERYSTICVAKLEQGRGGWAIVRNIL